MVRGRAVVPGATDDVDGDGEPRALENDLVLGVPKDGFFWSTQAQITGEAVLKKSTLGRKRKNERGKRQKN